MSLARRGATVVGLRLATAAVGLLVGLGILELAFGSWLRSNPWGRALALNIVVNRGIVYDATVLYENGGPVVYTKDQAGRVDGGANKQQREKQACSAGTNRMSWFSGLPQLVRVALVPVIAVSLMKERRSIWAVVSKSDT